MRHPNDGLLLATVIERYCAENPDGNKASTMTVWRFHLRAFGRRMGCAQDPVTKRLSGGPAAANVSGRYCLDWCLRDADGRPRTASTARAYKTALIAVFTWATDPDAQCPCGEDPTCQLHHRALLPLDPTSRLAKKVKELPLEEVDEKHWLTADQRDSIFAAYDTGTSPDRRDTVVMELYWGTLRRKAEVPRLRWRDVNFPGGSIRFMTKGRQKAGKPIDVPMSEDLKETLGTWRDDYKAGLRAAGWDDLRIQRDFPDLPVVCRLYHHAPNGIGRPGMEVRILWGRPIGPQGVDDILDKVRARTGLTFTCHDIRRSGAGIMEVEGETLEAIQEFLGHENKTTTELYLKGNTNRPSRRRTANSLNRRRRPA